MEQRSVNVNGSTISFVDRGEGPAILFVHGFPLDHQIWHYQIEELSNRFRVICPDLPGFGSSPSMDEPLSIDGLADVLSGLLGELEISQPVCFCGLSMGGYIGWQFWQKYRAKLSHIVACDTRAAADSETVSRARKISAKSVLVSGSASIADDTVAKLFCKSNRDKEMVSEVKEIICQTDPVSISQGQLAMAARIDATPWLREIEIPTLFAVGSADEITTPEEMRQNADLVQNSMFVEIPDAGHLCPLENHAKFNSALANFLSVNS